MRWGSGERQPLTLQRVRSLITAPLAGVDVKLNGGPWPKARRMRELLFRVEEPRVVEIHSRANDIANRTQPAQPEWNRLGYGNNAIQKIRLVVR